MATWMKKVFDADGITEYPPGPHLSDVVNKFGGSGAVVLCIDVSGSMAGRELEEAKKGGQGFVDDAEVGGYEVGLILWSTEIVELVPPSKDLSAVRRALKNAKATGGTRLCPALSAAQRELMGRNVTDRVVVVFTDGSLFDQEEAEKTANKLKADGIRILTMGLGPLAAAGLAKIGSPDAQQPVEVTTDSLANDMKQIASSVIKRKVR